MTYEYSATAQL